MKILVIFTGGTIGSSVSEDGYFSPDDSKKYKLLELFKKSEGNLSVIFETCEPYTILSEYLDGQHLSQLIACVREKKDKGYDGIIITHGTDTIQYSSCALSYAMGLKSIPIVLVSSNYILDDSRMNGLNNFKSAVDFIINNRGNGVFVSYENLDGKVYIHRGSRVERHASYDDQIFSISNEYYGLYDLKRSYIPNVDYAEKEDESDQLINIFEEDSSPVSWLKSYPGMNYDKIDLSVKAILIEGYHSGTINSKSSGLIQLIGEAKKHEIPVYLVGFISDISYESTKVYEELGIRILKKISPIAAYIKLSMILADGLDSDKVMNKSLGGDILLR